LAFVLDSPTPIPREWTIKILREHIAETHNVLPASIQLCSGMSGDRILVGRMVHTVEDWTITVRKADNHMGTALAITNISSDHCVTGNSC